VKIDVSLTTAMGRDVRTEAEHLEALGFDGLIAAETSHDPFMPLAVAATSTNRVDLMTGIAVAFPRSPMHLANVGHDLQLSSGGRFVLGLGSQIRAHNEARFSTPWFRPADRMRELILATKSIWRCWNEREPLDFRGEFYTHTLMTPFFNPGPCEYGPPKIVLAAVGERMTAVAAEVADGILVHGFTTKLYFESVTQPVIERELARGGRARSDFTVACPVFMVTGDNEQEMVAAATAVRRQIAFYGSTPAYRAVLDVHGWGDVQPELNAMSKQGRWREMGELITDEMLDAFAIVGPRDSIAERLRDRFDGQFDRVAVYAPYARTYEQWSADLVKAI